jgi:hypothetical protein
LPLSSLLSSSSEYDDFDGAGGGGDRCLGWSSVLLVRLSMAFLSRAATALSSLLLSLPHNQTFNSNLRFPMIAVAGVKGESLWGWLE